MRNRTRNKMVKYSPKKIKRVVIISSVIGVCLSGILVSGMVYAYKYARNIMKDIQSDKSKQELLKGNVINNKQISSYN